MICDPSIFDHDLDPNDERLDERHGDFSERRLGHRCRRCGMMVWSEWEPLTAADYRAMRDDDRLARWKEDRTW